MGLAGVRPTANGASDSPDAPARLLELARRGFTPRGVCFDTWSGYPGACRARTIVASRHPVPPGGQHGYTR